MNICPSNSNLMFSQIAIQEANELTFQQELVNTILSAQEGGTVRKNIVGTVDTSEIKIGVKGPEIFKMIADSVRNAKKEVLIQTFAWEGSQTDAVLWLRDSLWEVAEEKRKMQNPDPLKVYILIDERGCSAEFAFNGRFGKCWPATPESIGLFNEPGIVEVNVGVYHHNSVAGSHAKTVIVDSQLLIITGANFQNSNFGHLPAHDAAFAIKGSIAAGAREDFEYMWALRTNAASTENLYQVPCLDDAISQSEDALAILTTRTVSKFPKATLSNPQNVAFHEVLINAQKIIRIATPNLNAPFILRDLVEFINVKNGSIQLLLGKGFNDRREALFGGTNQYAVDYLVAGVDIDKQHFLNIRWFSSNGCDAVVGNVPGASHLKAMFVDDEITIFGNANLDCISVDHLHEVNVLIKDRDFTNRATGILFTQEFDRAVPATPTDGFMSTFLEKTGITGLKDRLANKYSTTILAATELDNNFKIIELARPEEWMFYAGQYVEVRSGSIASKICKKPAILAIASGINDKTIQLTARKSSNPLHPNHFMQKQAGETVEIKGPIGTSFPLHLLDAEIPLIVIGGGSGLTAIRSIMRSLDESQKVNLIYSAKTRGDLLYAEEVAQWKNNGHYISLTQDDVDGFEKGRVTDKLKEMEVCKNAFYFICGPTPLIKDCVALLKEKGIPEEQIYGSFPRDARRGGPVFRGDHPITK